MPLNAAASIILKRRQLGIFPEGVVGTIVKDPRDHTRCNSACVVASTRRDWIAAVTSNDGAHACWNPVRDAVCTRLIHGSDAISVATPCTDANYRSRLPCPLSDEPRHGE